MQPVNQLPFDVDVEFVVNELSRYTRRAEIVQEVMLRRGTTWAEADQFVQAVEAIHSGRVATRQAPLEIALGCTTLFGGTCLFCCVASYLFWIGWFSTQSLLVFARFLLSLMINPFGLLFLLAVLWLLWKSIQMMGGAVLGFAQTLRAMMR